MPELYRRMYMIRRLEETVIENFPRGVFPGTTHTCLGQEADAVGVLWHLESGDVVFSNHRGHGHFLAYGGSPHALFAELMGRRTGVCGGRGGSQHLHWQNFYSNGVQGGIVPVATGMALAEKLKGTQALVVVFLGDGTLGEGVVYEALNMASLWQVPILYVVENNGIAQTTPVELSLAGSISDRFKAFDIPTCSLDTSDVIEIQASAGMLFEQIRVQAGPRALILHTYRFGPHSKGDDLRAPEELERIRQQRDPLLIHGPRLDLETKSRIEHDVEIEIQTAFQQALGDPFPTPEDLLADPRTG